MVVTDVRGTQSGLVLTPELGGRITVREANGALVAELRKPAGNTIELGLEPGAYVVAMDSGSTIFQANVALTAGKHTPLAAAAFHAGRAARGDRRARRRRRRRRRASRPRRRRPPRRRRRPRREPTPFKLILLPARRRRARRRARLLVRLRRRSVAPRARLPARASAGRRPTRSCVALQLAAGANLARGQLRGRADRGGRQHPARRPAAACSWWAAATSSTAASSALQIAGGINTVEREHEGPADGRRRQLGGRRRAAFRWRAASTWRRTFTGAADGAGQLRGRRWTACSWASSTPRAHRERLPPGRRQRRAARATASRSASSTSRSTTTANRSRCINIIGNGIHDVSLFATDVMADQHRLQAGRPPPLHEPDRRLPARRRAGGRARALHGRHQALRRPASASAGAFPSSAARSRTPSSRPTGWRCVRSGTGSTTRRPWRRCACRRACGSRRHVVLLAGAGVNVAVATDGRDLDLGLRRRRRSVQHSGATTVRIYPGLLLGLQI